MTIFRIDIETASGKFSLLRRNPPIDGLPECTRLEECSATAETPKELLETVLIDGKYVAWQRAGPVVSEISLAQWESWNRRCPAKEVHQNSAWGDGALLKI